MAGIFRDRGRAPGDRNSGIQLATAPIGGCDALYYDETCKQKVSAAQLNAMISEIVSVLNSCPDLVYDCNRFDNLLRAIRCTTASESCELFNTVVFSYTGSLQTYTRTDPSVSFAIIKAWGAGGGGGSNAGSVGQVFGGGGGFAQGGILDPSGTYKIVVGRGGQVSDTSGGYGGGGPGGPGARSTGASGGGYSGLFLTSVSAGNAKLIAGGGGGGGSTFARSAGYPVHAGGGGGAVGQLGAWGGGGFPDEPYNGYPGTQIAGGAAGSIINGTIGTPGAALQGGSGASQAGISMGDGSGGGGGGWYGGGGGGNDDVDDGSNDRPGGGGSSYGASGLIGFNTIGANYDTPANMIDGNYLTGIGLGGQGLSGGGAGGHGRVVVLEFTGTCP